ncbi:MAG TPA: radical SAM protein [Bryobacteraceae bacterium]|jgi:radical SAM superfamily enzyme YgiQ (UPF0313 family)|nr:radical SAM protein [Bryobacteraceae bacterium]
MRNKVTLIKVEPQRTNVYSAFAYPGLALPLLGTVLKEKGYDVKIYVEAVRKWDWNRILESDLIGITVNSAEVKECYALADQIRAHSRVPIVMGGYHVTYMAEEALDHCDYVVRGEGEATLAELTDELLQGNGKVEKILGISYRRDGDVIENPDRPLIPNIDLIPDQSLIQGYADYHKRFFQNFFPTGALVASSRGCPYNCTFCSIIEVYRRTTRFRSPEAVIEDIRRQTRLTGRRYIFFADDNFTAHRRKCKSLLRHLIDAKLDIRFSAQVRLEFSKDEEFIQLMKEAGCYMVFIGFESINPQTLLDFQKKQTVEDIVYCIERLRRAKLHVHGMFVLGGDADDAETVRATARFAVEKQMDTVQFLPLYPLPGTQLIDQLKHEGRLLLTVNPETGRYELDYGVGNSVLMQPRNINPATLQRELLKAYETFYSVRNTVKSVVRGTTLQSLISKVVGRHLLKQGRKQIHEHIEWLQREGFARDWGEFVPNFGGTPPIEQLVHIKAQA